MLKRIFLIGLLVLLLSTLAYGALNTFTQSIDARPTVKGPYAWTGHSSRDTCWTWAKEVEDRLAGNTGNTLFYFAPGSAPTTAAKGMMYYDSSGNSLKYYTTSWQTLGTTAGVALDDAYDLGTTITADGGAVAITVTDASSNAGITIAQNDATNNSHGIVVTMCSSNTCAGLHIDGETGTVDILGDNWTIPNTGKLTCVGIDTTGTITMANDDIISNATNDKILFDTGDEDLLLDFTTTADTITLGTNSTGATTFAMGDFVTLTGLNTLTGAAGVDYTISAANTGTFNLVVAQTGVGDNELRLASAGTAANAIAIAAATGGVTVTTGSGANGDILMTSGDDITITSGDDIIITSTVGSLIKIGENDTAADTITIGSAKDTTVVAGVSMTVGSTGGTSATTIQSGTGDLALTSTDDITLTVNTTTTDNITLTNTPGTADNAIVVLASAGGIDVDATKSLHLQSAEEQGDALVLYASGTAGGVDITSGTGDVAIVSTDDITLTVNTTTTDNITLTNTPGTAVDAIAITATAGGITHTSNDCASTWTHTADGTGDDLSFIVAGAFDASIVLTSSGTLGNAIDINTSAGGIDIDMAGGAAGEDFDITTATSIVMTTSESAAGQFYVNATGTIADASGDAIILETTNGGILIDADHADNGDIGLEAGDDLRFTSVGDMTFTIGGHARVTDNDLVSFGATDDITMNYDEDGDDNLQIIGPVDFETTYVEFHSNPAGMQNDGSVWSGTNTETNTFVVDGTTFEQYIIGTVSLPVPALTADGLNVAMDEADDEGCEIGQGITARCPHYYTTNTDSVYFKVKFKLETVGSSDIIAVGWRKAGAYNVDMYTYTDYSCLNVDNGTINVEYDLSDAGVTSSDSGDSWSNGETHELEVRIDGDGLSTYYVDGTETSNAIPFDWTENDYIVPYFHHLFDATAGNEIELISWECGIYTQ